MEKYIEQLLSDIVCATENANFPYIDKDLNWHDILSDEEEEKYAPVRNLQEWTGISAVMLPSEELLDNTQVSRLLEAMKKMLDAYNWSFVLQIEVPERIQYTTIRNNFNQQAKVKQWNMGFFELCQAGTEHKKCTLGEFCQCAFYAELFSHFVDDDRSPEEIRASELEIEIQHLKRKYGDEWMKYYPYHLDPNYDDEGGNPYDYGLDWDDDDDDDDWWKH